MNPLALLALAAGGAAVVAKVAKPAEPPSPPPEVHPEIKNAGKHLALGHMKRGATPEEAAARAAEQLARAGGGFWNDKPLPEAVRF